jgi:hypothetical protein
MFFEYKAGSRACMAMSEAERGEAEMAARLQKMARIVKRGLKAAIIEY